MSNDEGLDPAFRARLRSELQRRAQAGDGEIRARVRARRPWRFAIVGSGVVALALGAAVFVGISSSQKITHDPRPMAVEQTVALCADEAIIVGGQEPHEGIEITVPKGDRLEQRILSACTRLWQDGELTSQIELQSSAQGAESSDEGAQSQGLSSSSRRKAVPPLTFCALQGGTLVVVPYVPCAEGDLAPSPTDGGD